MAIILVVLVIVNFVIKSALTVAIFFGLVCCFFLYCLVVFSQVQQSSCDPSALGQGVLQQPTSSPSRPSVLHLLMYKLILFPVVVCCIGFLRCFSAVVCTSFPR